MATYPEKVELEFIMLADKAEVMSGKLYMMGGGYDRRIINDIESPVSICIVVSILVPWNFTNERHSIHVRVETEDGEVVGKEIQGNLIVGRNIESVSGQMFRAMSVINLLTRLPKLGGYKTIATLDNGESKTTAFYAVSVNMNLQPTG